jgi:chlorite dismutase
MSDEIKRQYVNYLFFKADPAWRRLSREERDRGRSEFEGVVKDWKGRTMIIPFSTVGTRADTDFVLWRISERLEDFTEMSTQLLNTSLGKWCFTPYSYLGMTKRSMYVDHHEHEGSEGRRGRVIPGQNKYIFIYPFWKTSEWYLLSKEERQRMMNVHIETGHRYPEHQDQHHLLFRPRRSGVCCRLRGGQTPGLHRPRHGNARTRGAQVHAARHADFHLYSWQHRRSAGDPWVKTLRSKTQGIRGF